jgi:hypothetical protein
MGTEERAAIGGVVEGIARDVDQRRWEDLWSRFADEVRLDYGAPETLTPGEIVSRWRPLLSAFDATEHVVHEVAVQRDGDRARAASRFTALHRLGPDRWVLEGRWEHELARTSLGWRASAMRMIPEKSTGEEVLERAKARMRSEVVPLPPGVSVERVRFLSEGTPLVGDLYLPRAPAAGARPALVVTGSWTTVKEQMPAEYAKRLAAAGYAALTFDFRGWGESSGLPRQYESPARKAQDIASAVSFLAGDARVERERIALLGVCASSGYAAQVAATDARVRTLVLVAPWLHDAPLVRATYGGDEGVRERTERGRAARSRWEHRGELEVVPAASRTDPSAAMYWEGDFLDYYLNPSRGAIPRWSNRFAVMSWPEWLEYDAVSIAPRVKVPTLLVHSEQAAIPDGARSFHRQLRVPARMVWTDAPSQFHFYDDARTIDRALEVALDHLRATL